MGLFGFTKTSEEFGRVTSRAHDRALRNTFRVMAFDAYVAAAASEVARDAYGRARYRVAAGRYRTGRPELTVDEPLLDDLFE